MQSLNYAHLTQASFICTALKSRDVDAATQIQLDKNGEEDSKQGWETEAGKNRAWEGGIMV